MCHFYYIKSDSQLSAVVVDCSNKSLYYSNEELDPNLGTGTPLQKSFEKVDVDVDSKCRQLELYLRTDPSEVHKTLIAN